MIVVKLCAVLSLAIKLRMPFVDISGSHHDGSMNFTTRLVPNGSTYSWNGESAEKNASLLEKAGLVAHEHCTPYLASVKANENCKVDVELRRVEGFVVKVPSPDKALRGDHTRGDDIARETDTRIPKTVPKTRTPLLRKGVSSTCQLQHCVVG